MPTIAQAVQSNQARIAAGPTGAPVREPGPVGGSSGPPTVGVPTFPSRGGFPPGLAADDGSVPVAGVGFVRSGIFIPSSPAWLIKSQVNPSVAQGLAQTQQKLIGKVFLDLNTGQTTVR